MKTAIPLFSILIPVYNMSNYLRQCLNSIREQTFTDWEAIFVNDASTDNSLNILQEYADKDPRIIIINHEHNKNLYAARSTAIQAARGKYAAFLDADDYLDRKFLETGKKMIEADDYLLVKMGYKCIHGNQHRSEYPKLSEVISSEDFLYGGYVLSKYSYVLWGNIYLTEMLKKTDIHYDQPIFDFEDILRMTNLVTHSDKKIRIETGKKMYYYRLGAGVHGRKSYSFQDIEKLLIYPYAYVQALSILPAVIRESSVQKHGTPEEFCSFECFRIIVEKMKTKEDFLKGVEAFCKIYGHELFHQHLTHCHIVCMKCSFFQYLKQIFFFLILAAKHIGKKILRR
ncbi:MAG: glycosyltransferase family 2 protein [Lentisphaeria bacterium]|nr:glycosyltransferase family 2 protein [Lentisphaeria bacterium]